MAFATITCIWRECPLSSPNCSWLWGSLTVSVSNYTTGVGGALNTHTVPNTTLCKNFGVKRNLISRDQIKHDTIWRLLCELPAATGHVPVFSISVLMSPPWPLVTPLSLKSPLPVVMYLCCNPLSLADFDVHVHTQRFTICSKTVLQTQNTFESGLQSAALIYFYRR